MFANLNDLRKPRKTMQTYKIFKLFRKQTFVKVAKCWNSRSWLYKADFAQNPFKTFFLPLFPFFSLLVRAIHIPPLARKTFIQYRTKKSSLLRLNPLIRPHLSSGVRRQVSFRTPDPRRSLARIQDPSQNTPPRQLIRALPTHCTKSTAP